MKFSRQQLKSLIKECVKEVIFEEGFLSGIISEVVVGLNKAPLLEQKTATEAMPPTRRKEVKKRVSKNRKMLLDAIGKDAYGDVDLFEGTRPLTTSQASGPPAEGALAGVDPDDAGINVNNIPGAANWKNLI
jgi:hypothetical protein